jgi:penicillin-binding protein 1A
MSAEPAFEEVDDEAPPRRRIRKRWVAAGLMLVFLALFGWLFVTAPLDEALEPRDDNALILLSADGRPIARRGSYMERAGGGAPSAAARGAGVPGD